MRFTSLRLSDFRGTRELEIGFEPDITVIVGRNGAGKTSILDALAMMVAIVRYAPGDLPHNRWGFSPAPSDIRWGAQCSTLHATYETGNQPSGRLETNTLGMTIVPDAEQPGLIRASGKLTLSQLRFI